MQDELYVPCPPMRIMPWPARVFLFFTPDREGEFGDSGLIKVAEVFGYHVVELLLGGLGEGRLRPFSCASKRAMPRSLAACAPEKKQEWERFCMSSPSF
jgi:hypothetical protein